MNLPTLDWKTWAFFAAAVVAAASLAFYLLRRRPADPEEVERRRRTYLNQVGRIVEGHIMEITEALVELNPKGRRGSPASSTKRTMVLYSYSISGVTYETAQDITGIQTAQFQQRLVGGQPVSVKYDPSNPGNSILLADDWSGLH